MSTVVSPASIAGQVAKKHRLDSSETTAFNLLFLVLLERLPINETQRLRLLGALKDLIIELEKYFKEL